VPIELCRRQAPVRWRGSASLGYGYIKLCKVRTCERANLSQKRQVAVYVKASSDSQVPPGRLGELWLCATTGTADSQKWLSHCCQNYS
jgi:hypothetical protein